VKDWGEAWTRGPLNDVRIDVEVDVDVAVVLL